MPLWRVAGVEDEPEIEMVDWQIVETVDQYKTRHFAGWNVYRGFVGEGRISSPIKSFDPVTRTGYTESGRKYVLHGEPGYNRDVEYVLNKWMYYNKIADVVIVTKDLL